MGKARARLPGAATAVSVLAHAGLLWAAVSSLPPPPAIYEVEIIALTFAAVRGDELATAETRPPAAPAAKEQAKEPLASRPPPMALPTPVAPSAPAAESSPSPATAPPSPAPFVHPPIRSFASATPPPPPQRKGARDGLDIDAPNGDGADYASKLRSWLEAHKTYPKRARMMRLTGVATVRFSVDRQGRLLSGEIVSGSGHADLDQEVLAMLNRADPFPIPPRGVPGAQIEITTPVEFSLRR